MGLVSGLYGVANAKKDKRSAQAAASENRQFIEGLNYDPVYAQDLMSQPYQKSQSPVADSYLNSILMGNNPATTRSSDPNAAGLKAAQTASQTAMFGTPDYRMKQEQQLSSTNPYQVSMPNRQVGKNADGVSQAWAARNQDVYGKGMTDSMANDLQGVVKLNGDGTAKWDSKYAKKGNISDEDMAQLVSLYNAGDRDGIDALYSQNKGKKPSFGHKLGTQLKDAFVPGVHWMPGKKGYSVLDAYNKVAD